MGVFSVRNVFFSAKDTATQNTVMTYSDGTTYSVDLYGGIDDTMLLQNGIRKYVFDVNRMELQEYAV